MNFIGGKCGYMPSDLLHRHKGEKIVAYWLGDVVMPHIFKGIMFAPEDKKQAGAENLVKNVLPAALEMLDKLMCGTKYICGDTITQYDFQVAGVIMNLGMYNEN